jgi:hypothetical protein
MFGEFVIRLASLPQAAPQFPLPLVLNRICMFTDHARRGRSRPWLASNPMLITAICFKRRVAPFAPPSRCSSSLSRRPSFSTCFPPPRIVYPLTLVTHFVLRASFLLDSWTSSTGYRNIYSSNETYLARHLCTRANCTTFKTSGKSSETRHCTCAIALIRSDRELAIIRCGLEP